MKKWKTIKAELGSIAKAVAAFLVPGLVFLTAQLTGDQSFSDLTTVQWMLAVGAVLGTPAAVYGVANKPRGS